jgi:hypothetical protein
MLALIAAAGAFLAAINGRFDEAIGWIVAVVGGVGVISTMMGWDWADLNNAMAYTVIGVTMLLLGAGAVAALHLLDAFGWAALFPTFLGVLGIGNTLCGAWADHMPRPNVPKATPPVTAE